MKYYFSSIIPKITAFSQKLDKISIICNRKWTIIDNDNEPTHYIFRENNELLIIKQGVVTKSKWEIISKDGILIEQEDSTLLFKQAFIDENTLVLNLDNTKSYLYFVDREKSDVATIEALENMLTKKYLPKTEEHRKEEQLEKLQNIKPYKEINDENEGNLGIIIFLSVLLFLGIMGGISAIVKTKDLEKNVTYSVPEKKDEKPSRETIEATVSSNVDKFVKENISDEELVPLNKTTSDENLDEKIVFYSNFLHILKSQYPRIFEEKNLVFYSNFSLGGAYYNTGSGFSFYGNQDELETILSKYKSCYDKSENNDYGYGYNKNFCALMIGKIHRYILSKNDVQSHKTAMKWFKNSQTLSAYLNIASYYENGVINKNDFWRNYIIRKDVKEAVKWYKKAFSSTKDEKAKQKIDILSIKGYD